MKAPWNLERVGLILLSGVLCASIGAQGLSTQSRKKAKKAPPPPLPSGPTGQPVPQVPLDSIAAIPPQVTYQNNELTIVAPNSTLADILRAVRKQTGAEIDVPAAPERVVTHLGPGPARDVLSDLLNGSRFNYVLLGSPGNEALLTRVVLVPKVTQPGNPNPQPMENQQANAEPQPAPEQQAADADADTGDDNSANDDQQQEAPPAEAEQQQNPEQPNVKTPQQMLQEMQQRQLQLQQQQPPGQPPVPGSGMPPRPPQPQ